jgi:hypothetical protein
MPSIGGNESEKKATSAPTSRQMRESIKAGRTERDADITRQKNERMEKKSSGLKMSERWAANKEANR